MGIVIKTPNSSPSSAPETPRMRSATENSSRRLTAGSKNRSAKSEPRRAITMPRPMLRIGGT